MFRSLKALSEKKTRTTDSYVMYEQLFSTVKEKLCVRLKRLKIGPLHTE